MGWISSVRAALEGALSPQPVAVVVVSEASEIRARVAELQEAGDPVEVVLTGLIEFIDRLAARSDDERLVSWIAREVPAATGRAGQREVEAVRMLRERVPGLSLLDAVNLVRKVRGLTP